MTSIVDFNSGAVTDVKNGKLVTNTDNKDLNFWAHINVGDHYFGDHFLDIFVDQKDEFTKEVKSFFVCGQRRINEHGTMVKFQKINGKEEFHAVKCMGWYIRMIK